MSAGDNANVGFSSYVAVGRETTFKTYNTCTAGLCFLSSSIRTIKENKILEQICGGKRTYSERVSLGRVHEGDIEFYLSADSDAGQYFLQNAMGGGVPTSATAVGDTAGTSAFEHTMSINAFDVTYTSLCLNIRKGDATNGQVFEYAGVRVNEFSISGEIDEPLKANVSVIAVSSTATSNDVSSALTVTGQTPLNFDSMRLSVESTFASLTASAFWAVQSFELGFNNQLKADSSSRRLGSDLLTVLPPGVVQFTFNFVMRFDTLTAYNAMLNETQYSAQISAQGDTLTGSLFREEIRFDMPRIYISDAGDPEIGGPEEILTANIVAHVLRDKTTSTGYALQAVVRNEKSSYA